MTDDDIDWYALSNGLSTVMPDGTLVHATEDTPMTNRYVPNGPPLTPHEAELLTILMEECAEVIHAAAKLIRFGKENRPDIPGTANSEVLGLEIGDLYEVVEHLLGRKIVTQRAIDDGAERKAERLHYYMQTEQP